MAGDWIKLECTTPDKPEVVQIAALLNADQDEMLGKLLRVWVWADQNSLGGEALRITAAFIDRLAGRPGFAEAMRRVGWLAGEDGALTFPNFERHNGITAKKRAETNRRIANHRQRNAPPTSTPSPSSPPRETRTAPEPVTHFALQKALPEKRREEESTDLLPTIPAHIPPPPFAASPQAAAAAPLDAARGEGAVEWTNALNLEALNGHEDRDARHPAHPLPASEPRTSPRPSTESSASLARAVATVLFTPPTLDRAKAFAPSAGISAEVAHIWWHECEARPLAATGHYTDRDGNPIRNWQAHLTSYGHKWVSNQARRSCTPAPTHNSGGYAPPRRAGATPPVYVAGEKL